MINDLVALDITDKEIESNQPSNQNGVTFHHQCKNECIATSATKYKFKCCLIEMHKVLKKISDYVVFPAKRSIAAFLAQKIR